MTAESVTPYDLSTALTDAQITALRRDNPGALAARVAAIAEALVTLRAAWQEEVAAEYRALTLTARREHRAQKLWLARRITLLVADRQACLAAAQL